MEILCIGAVALILLKFKIDLIVWKSKYGVENPTLIYGLK